MQDILSEFVSIVHGWQYIAQLALHEGDLVVFCDRWTACDIVVVTVYCDVPKWREMRYNR